MGPPRNDVGHLYAELYQRLGRRILPVPIRAVRLDLCHLRITTQRSDNRCEDRRTSSAPKPTPLPAENAAKGTNHSHAKIFPARDTPDHGNAER